MNYEPKETTQLWIVIQYYFYEISGSCKEDVIYAVDLQRITNQEMGTDICASSNFCRIRVGKINTLKFQMH